ncbi:hypothetical protein BDW71DRAFT_201230 [Aspergillus fruticulosus]
MSPKKGLYWHLNHHGFSGQGKVVLITGGASGVGFSIAKALAAAGVARIAIAAYPSVRVVLFQASVADSARMTGILRELGPVDVLVLSAAVVHRREKATAITEQELRDAFDTNVIAAFNLIKSYLETPLPASGQKTIINISAAAQVHATHRVGYGSSKAAVAQFLQHFAVEQEQAPDDNPVRIFSFHPGSFYMPAVAQHFTKDELKWEDMALLGDFAVWLAGPESSLLHGRHLRANWDVDELTGLKERVLQNRRFLTIGLVV